MSTLKDSRILLTGATGFIGGTILDVLLKNNPTLQITCLIRGDESRVSGLKNAYGHQVNVRIYSGLDDFETATEVASEHDLVINTTHGFHQSSVISLIKGLRKRKEQTGSQVFLIHTSGTSNLSDQPFSETYVHDPPDLEFDDERDDIYGYEEMRNKLSEYDQRTADLKIVDAGILEGVNVVIVMAPGIYGVGRGLFNKHSVLIPCYVRATLKAGYAFVIGDGGNEADHVHVEDLAELYEILLLNIMQHEGRDIPWGKKGIIFAGNHRATWKSVASEVAIAAHAAELIPSTEVKHVSLQTGADFLTGGILEAAETNLSVNARTKASVAARLGWKATFKESLWLDGFKQEVQREAEKAKRGDESRSQFQEAYKR